MKLTQFEEMVADYLQKHHKKDNPISMKVLSKKFDQDDRDMRDIITNIILSQRIIIGGGNRGYWVASENPEEIKAANKTRKATIATSIEKLAANKGGINWIYSHLNELKKKYETVPEGQLDIYEQLN